MLVLLIDRIANYAVEMGLDAMIRVTSFMLDDDW
jgi:hypothetical protein